MVMREERKRKITLCITKKERIMKKVFSLFLLLFLPILANAETVEIDGVWYNLLSEKAQQAEVVKPDNGSYYGKIVIPQTITYGNVIYNVTTIGEQAFYYCTDLIEVTIPISVTAILTNSFSGCSNLVNVDIPNSVTYIGHRAFYGCSSLKTLNIPNSVKQIDVNAFERCSGLTEVFLPNSINEIESHVFRDCVSLTGIRIPESVTNIGAYSFSGCSKLKELVIGESVMMIDKDAFQGCISLESVYLPKSITYIGDRCFCGCSNLKNIHLPDSLQNLGGQAFLSCANLESVIIPRKVTIIGEYTFDGCSELADVTLLGQVRYIGKYAFRNCAELVNVYCHAENVPSAEKNSFEGSYIECANLHVPDNAVNNYRSATLWSKFGTIKPLSGEEVEVKKCALPTINYNTGKLTFDCETDGVEYISDIICDDIKQHYDAEVPLSMTYTIHVYATKIEYENSDIATATLCWIECDHKNDTHKVESIPATMVLVQSSNGIITIQGLEKGTFVSVYNISGMEMVRGIAEENKTLTLDAKLQTDEIAVVKMGSKSIKVTMK